MSKRDKGERNGLRENLTGLSGYLLPTGTIREPINIVDERDALQAELTKEWRGIAEEAEGELERLRKAVPEDVEEELSDLLFAYHVYGMSTEESKANTREKLKDRTGKFLTLIGALNTIANGKFRWMLENAYYCGACDSAYLFEEEFNKAAKAYADRKMKEMGG